VTIVGKYPPNPRVGVKPVFLEHFLRSSKKNMELASNSKFFFGVGVAGAERVWHDMLVKLVKFLEWSSLKHAYIPCVLAVLIQSQVKKLDVQ